MGNWRTRLTLAFLVVAAATLLASSGSAGNRTAEVTFQALPGDSVTYGESFATTTTFKNTGNSNFTHVQLRQLVPATGGANPASATLLDSSCGAVIVGNEAVCEFDSLGSGQTATATLLWGAPASGAGCASCLATSGIWLIKEGKPTNSNEVFPFPATPFAATLLGGDGSQEKKKAGGYETQGVGVGSCTAGAGNLHTNPALTNTDPVSSTVCLPLFTIPTGSFAFGLSSTITEITTEPATGVQKTLGQSVVCVAALGQSCVAGHVPFNWGTTTKARHVFRILGSALTGNKTITKVFHNGAELKLCSTTQGASSLNGCVVSITSSSSFLSFSPSSSNTNPPSGNKVWTVVADAPTNGPWNW